MLRGGNGGDIARGTRRCRRVDRLHHTGADGARGQGGARRRLDARHAGCELGIPCGVQGIERAPGKGGLGAEPPQP